MRVLLHEANISSPTSRTLTEAPCVWISNTTITLLGSKDAAQQNLYLNLFYTVACLEFTDAGKDRDCSGDVCLGDESHSSNHCQTAVVEFTGALSLQSLCTDTGEVNWWENHAWQISSLHVVGSLVSLSDKFGNEASEEDLCLALIRDSGPSVKGLHAGERFERDIGAQHTREVKSRSLDEESNGSNHCGSAVLQLSSLEPSESFFTSNVGQTKRVEALDGQSASWHIVKDNGTERSACL